MTNVHFLLNWNKLMRHMKYQTQSRLKKAKKKHFIPGNTTENN